MDAVFTGILDRVANSKTAAAKYFNATTILLLLFSSSRSRHVNYSNDTAAKSL